MPWLVWWLTAGDLFFVVKRISFVIVLPCTKKIHDQNLGFQTHGSRNRLVGVGNLVTTDQDPINLTIIPSESLQGEEGRRKIELGLHGVPVHVIETIDGFKYNLLHSAYMGITLVMQNSKKGNTYLLRYWVEDIVIYLNRWSNVTWTALTFANHYGPGGSAGLPFECGWNWYCTSRGCGAGDARSDQPIGEIVGRLAW